MRASLRNAVCERARNCCEYCQMQSKKPPLVFEVAFLIFNILFPTPLSILSLFKFIVHHYSARLLFYVKCMNEPRYDK